MKHETTRAHYEKYRSLAVLLGVRLDPAKGVGVYTTEELRAMYRADPALNQMTLRWFDFNYSTLRMNPKCPRTFSLAENVCLYKHLIIYQLLEAKPEFTDSYGYDAHLAEQQLDKLRNKVEYLERVKDHALKTLRSGLHLRAFNQEECRILEDDTEYLEGMIDALNWYIGSTDLDRVEQIESKLAP
jgi:hypothetical protein